MSLSDCMKCWDTPCSCGWEYRKYTNAQLSSHIASITQYRSKKEAKAIINNALLMIDKMDNWQNKIKE